MTNKTKPTVSFFDQGIDAGAWLSQDEQGKIGCSVSLRKKFKGEGDVIQERKISFFQKDIPVVIQILTKLYSSILERRNEIYRKNASETEPESPGEKKE